MTDKLSEIYSVLKDECLACWAIEISDIFPKSLNREIANRELAYYGHPDCRCKGESARRLKLFRSEHDTKEPRDDQ